MTAHQRSIIRSILLIVFIATLSSLSGRIRSDTGTCGGASVTLPFTDVSSSNVFFCSIAAAAFDGQRVMVVNNGANSVSLWKAADLSPLGSINLAIANVQFTPTGVCSDGVNFWVTADASNGQSYLIRL